MIILVYKIKYKLGGEKKKPHLSVWGVVYLFTLIDLECGFSYYGGISCERENRCFNYWWWSNRLFYCARIIQL
jgi:hypothetical protein